MAKAPSAATRKAAQQRKVYEAMIADQRAKPWKSTPPAANPGEEEKPK